MSPPFGRCAREPTKEEAPMEAEEGLKTKMVFNEDIGHSMAPIDLCGALDRNAECGRQRRSAVVVS